MPRARVALVIAAGALVAVAGLAAAPTLAAQPVPPTTTVAVVPTTVAVVPTTVAATPSAVPASTPAVAAPASTIPRAPSGVVDVRKPEAESWDLRQVLTILGLVIVALAALGYAYGRIRSIAPRHPGLVRSVE